MHAGVMGPFFLAMFAITICMISAADCHPHHLIGSLAMNHKAEREREIHYVHSASLAYEDGIVFMSDRFAARK